jgi:hypothetical protein
MVPAELNHLHPRAQNENLLALVGKKQSTNTPQSTWHDIDSYKKSLPPERRRLLAWSSPRPPYRQPDIIKILNLLHSHPLIECGSDGSLNEKKGTYGYAISIDGQIFWQGAGPADGNTATANSKRAELYGYAGCLESCLMLLTVVQRRVALPQASTIQIWIDNTSADRNLNKLLSKKTHQTKYPHNPDILFHIQWLWSQMLGQQQEVKWVKAHQDDNLPFDALPLNAKLNTIADQMATIYSAEA